MHAPPLEDVYAHASRVLKPGGTLGSIRMGLRLTNHSADNAHHREDTTRHWVEQWPFPKG